MPASELASIAAYWDESAAAFDEEADHGLRDPHVNAAWARRLTEWLPDSPADVLDLGCGTGSLTLLMARQGHRPTGVDLSPRMIELATGKLASSGFEVPFMVGDAGDPPAAVGGPFDAIVVRHLVWTLPAPDEALARWLSLLRPGGRLVLVEGRWQTSPNGDTYAPGSPQLPWLGGVTAARLIETLERLADVVHTEHLPDPALWGHPIQDERYVVIAHPKS
ncbi:class I SAM-dependent methyltransferase [Nonomuraea aridisoli]|uniref:SAM-dependent methyltransferase n=1 Tax=Nonomuraea aridisoli TaxID=2070368 RepID=A0A2W2DQX0_9ACTN|nr:class I SAM-dependent methyltransferase [Nonomuraea aridisoli]PZG12601.1 SAM-dependent methyltransferase [Nonomuraea aridisoli]